MKLPAARLTSRFIAGFILLTVSAGVSGAATINIDINNSDGTAGTFAAVGAAPDTGTTWNGVAAGQEGGGSPTVASFTSAPLVTSTGTLTTVTFSLGNFKCYDAQENPAASANRALLTDFVYEPGGVGPGGPNATFSINNLDPLSTYDLYFYAQNGGYSNTATIFTIGVSSLTATNVAPVPPATAPATFIQGTNYVKFSGIAPNGSGVISGTFNDVAVGNNAAFNGLQIVQVVPEPSAAAALTLAGLLTLRRRR